MVHGEESSEPPNEFKAFVLEEISRLRESSAGLTNSEYVKLAFDAYKYHNPKIPRHQIFITKELQRQRKINPSIKAEQCIVLANKEWIEFKKEIYNP